MNITALSALALITTACGLKEIPREVVRPDGPSATSDPPAVDASAVPRDAQRTDGSGAPRPPDGDAAVSDVGPVVRNDAGPDAPVSSSGGIVVGGTLLPREKVIVFLHIGHSNMAGRTDTPASLRPYHFETHPRLWSYTMARLFQPAKEPLSGDFLTMGRAGPGMSILRAALAIAAAPDSVMVSIGHGHDGSRAGFCRSYRRGGVLYDIVMGPAKQLRGKVTFGGIFTMLALTEVFPELPNLPTFHQCIAGIASEMRADLGDPDIPFMMSDWEMGATGKFAPTFPNNEAAREQLRMAQKIINRSAIIPTDNLPMSDNHHFDLTGYKIWGERAVGLIQQHGWAPWGNP
jgi:hypothetical protein